MSVTKGITMFIEQYLLNNMMEESSEIAQAASKVLRFTALHRAPGSDTDNLSNLIIELNDLYAHLDLLESFYGKIFNRNEALIAAKKARISKYLEISWKLGTLKVKDLPDGFIATDAGYLDELPSHKLASATWIVDYVYTTHPVTHKPPAYNLDLKLAVPF